MREDLVYADCELFPQATLPFLESLCGWPANSDSILLSIYTELQELRQLTINFLAGKLSPSALLPIGL